MARRAQLAADETPPTDRPGCLSRLIPTWRDLAIVTICAVVGIAAEECGLKIVDDIRTDTRADMAACLNKVEGNITDNDIIHSD